MNKIKNSFDLKNHSYYKRYSNLKTLGIAAFIGLFLTVNIVLQFYADSSVKALPSPSTNTNVNLTYSPQIPPDDNGNGVPDNNDVPPTNNNSNNNSGGGGTTTFVPNFDLDGDGILDSIEDAGCRLYYQCTPQNRLSIIDKFTDSDGDGVPDYIEIMYGLNPLDDRDVGQNKGRDGDGDNVGDGLEFLICKFYALCPDPYRISDTSDFDGDGLTDVEEFGYRLDPTKAGEDTDGDGTTSALEILLTKEYLLDVDQNGKPDFMDGSIATIITTNKKTLVTVVVMNKNCQIYKGLFSKDETELSKQNEKYNFPFGFNEFKVKCTHPGEETPIEVIYHIEQFPKDFRYIYFSNNRAEYTDISKIVNLDVHLIAGKRLQKITYTLKDGDQYDDDTKSDSIITDPSGLGVIDPAFKNRNWWWWLLLLIPIYLYYRHRRKSKIEKQKLIAKNMLKVIKPKKSVTKSYNKSNGRLGQNKRNSRSR